MCSRSWPQASRFSGDEKLPSLLLQITLLKQSLETQLSQSQSSLQQLQNQFSQEREHLRLQLDELQTEHQRRQQRLQEAQLGAMQDLELARQRDLKVLFSWSLLTTHDDTNGFFLFHEKLPGRSPLTV